MEPDGQGSPATVLTAVSTALVALHKEQFGRGPTHARSYFSGDDGLTCVLDDVLLPAERELVRLGDAARVRDTRGSFQAVTAARFIDVVERHTQRRVRAFASGIDPDNDVVFENFSFEPRDDPS